MASVAQIKTASAVMKTTVVIDSKFRTSGEINNFSYDLGTTIENVQLIEILNVDFVNILQNVDTSNNKLNWVDHLTIEHLDVITPGNYNTTTLLTTIGETMTDSTTSDDFYSATLNFNTGQITITNSEGVTFDLNFGVSPAESIGPILGFGTTNYTDITSQEGPELINLYPSKHIFVGSTAIGGPASDSFLLSNGISNVIYQANVDGIFTEIIHNEDVKSFKENAITLTKLDFQLYDDNGLRLVIPETVNEEKGTFSITLDIYSGIFALSYYDGIANGIRN